MLTWVFWLAMASLAYMYAGFPLTVALLGLLRRQTVRKAPVQPTLSLIVAAYNEEASIGARLENALASDYPRDRLQIVVASDGSSDATNAIVEQYEARGVQLLALPRRGKVHALNEAVRHATGEILVFSDANTMCDRQALAAIAANFADPAVGGVAGHTSCDLEAVTESSSRGERLYWNYDTWLKSLESQTGSVVSAHGGLHALRRSLYRPIADAAVTDDFAISTAVVEQGYRLVFEAGACAAELAVPEAQREFRRRVRLMTRGLRGVVLRRRLLNPFRHGIYALVLFSHKVLRRLAPISLLLLAVSSVLLARDSRFFFAATLAQTGFYGLALAGWGLRKAGAGGLGVFYVPFYYCLSNGACAVALVQLAAGKRIELWQPQRGGL